MKAERVVLAVTSVAGIIGAVACAIYETPKAEEALKEYKLKKCKEELEEIKEGDKEEKEEKKDIRSIIVRSTRNRIQYVGVAVPHFWRTAACVAIAVGSELLFFKITTKELLLLSSTVGYLVADRKNIEHGIIDVVGEDKYKEIKAKALEKAFNDEPCSGQTIEETGEGNLLCKDEFSGRLFRSSETSVLEGIKYFKDTLKDNKCACYNNLYAYWGIECSEFGEKFGYAYDEDEETYPKPENIHIGTYIDYNEKYKENMLHIYFEDPYSEPDDNWRNS